MSHLTNHCEDPENLKGFQQERLLLDVAALIYRTMKDKKIKTKELAKKLGTRKRKILQILEGRNLTLREAADIFTALDSTLIIATENLTLEK